jgi:hypothetical protein
LMNLFQRKKMKWLPQLHMPQLTIKLNQYKIRFKK